MGVDKGVNITLGLPFVRTSPDQGTAFDIAGQGVADATSFETAMSYAKKLVQAQRVQEKMTLKFIIMLTRNDKTVEDARDHVSTALKAGVKHIGFKDVGVSFDTLNLQNEDILKGGATSYLEVVSLDKQSEVMSAKAAKEIGVNNLLGGTNVSEVLSLI